MSEQSTQKIGYKDIFRQKEYMKMILANLVNRFGDSIDAVAFTWLVYQLTGSAAWSALIFGLNKIPTILVTPFAGAWVEGRNKKWIMVWTDFGRAVCVAAVATGYWMGILTAWMLLLATLMISLLEAFRIPAGTAITPKILDEKYYEYGLSLSSSISNVTQLLGMAIAGGIIALIGVHGAIYVDMATFLISGFFIMNIRTGEEEQEKQKFEGKEYVQSLVGGVKYIKQSRTFLFFTAVCLLLNGLLTPINSLMAPLSSEVLHADALMVSLISVMATVGMVAGSVTYPWARERIPQRMLFALSGFGISVYYIGMILFQPLYENPGFAYIYVGFTTGMLGCFSAWLATLMSVELIRKIEPDFLARAAGISAAADSASMPIMSFVISALIGFTGTAYIFLGTGIIAVILCGIMVRSKELDEMPEAVTGIAES